MALRCFYINYIPCCVEILSELTGDISHMEYPDFRIKAQKFQRLPGFFAPIFRGVTKRCQNGLWQIRWTCTFTQGILSRFSEDFSGKWLFFVLGKV